MELPPRRRWSALSGNVESLRIRSGRLHAEVQLLMEVACVDRLRVLERQWPTTLPDTIDPEAEGRQAALEAALDLSFTEDHPLEYTDMDQFGATGAPSAYDDIEAAEIESALLRAMGTLKEPRRSLLHLLYRDGLTQRDAADRLGMSYPRANAVHRGSMEILRQKLSVELGLQSRGHRAV